MWTISDSHNDFRSSCSTPDLLAVVSDTIARFFNRSGATRAIAFVMSRAFWWVQYAGLLHRLKSYGIYDLVFSLIFRHFLVIDRFEWV